jgi:hypothetical protein
VTGQTEWSVNITKFLKMKELSASILLQVIVKGQDLAGRGFGSEICYVGWLTQDPYIFTCHILPKVDTLDFYILSLTCYVISVCLILLLVSDHVEGFVIGY